MKKIIIYVEEDNTGHALVGVCMDNINEGTPEEVRIARILVGVTSKATSELFEKGGERQQVVYEKPTQELCDKIKARFEGKEKK